MSKLSQEQINVDLFNEVKRLKEKQRWIPVTERLPEKGKRVLASDGENVVECYRRKSDGLWQGWTFLNDEYLAEITHWQPLPQPPKNQ